MNEMQKAGAEGGIVKWEIAKVFKIKAIPPFLHSVLPPPPVPLC